MKFTLAFITLFITHHCSAQPRTTYKRYEQPIIVINENTIQYGAQVFRLEIADSVKTMFTKGLLYPELFCYKMDMTDSSGNRNKVPPFFACDTLSIANVVEIKSNHNYKTRRFKLWFWRQKFMNPTEYEFEITNQGAPRGVDLKTFIEQAWLTELRFITIII